MLLVETGSEDEVNVVHIVPSVSRVAIENQIDDVLRIDRCVVRWRAHLSVCLLVHVTGNVVVLHELRAVHELREVGVHRNTERGVVADFCISLLSPLGGYDNHTAGCGKAVDGSGSTVLEHRNALDVGRVNVVDVVNRETVHNVAYAVDRAADTQACLVEARLTGLLNGRNTREFTRKDLSHIGGRSLEQFVSLDCGYGAGH